MRTSLHRRTGLGIAAAVMALTSAVALASPASAAATQHLRPYQTSVVLDGVRVNAIAFATDPAMTSGDSEADITLIIDERGGWKFRGVTVNNNWTWRHQTIHCEVLNRAGLTALDVSTSRYKIGARSSKRWDWEREWTQYLQTRFADMRYTATATCDLFVG